MSNLLNAENRAKLQTLSTLKRYNNALHFHDENVAEHSFYTALYAMEISHLLAVDYYVERMAVEKALIHDVHEIVLSDIPHVVKKSIPKIETACLEFEENFNARNFEHLMKEYEFLSGDQQEVVDLIVNLSDVISVMQYSEQELAIGNKVFSTVKQSAESRINAIIAEMRRYFKPIEIKTLEENIFATHVKGIRIE